ncbi:hypothetical protein [Teredinibacter turnerae]|uniref:hypothetical protein n=1 Tax=Teredinibacter turnerae TaxID=2426 RepID=UPI0005F7A773|nr:hypothetical protein [Teredinibacter turnerae]
MFFIFFISLICACTLFYLTHPNQKIKPKTLHTRWRWVALLWWIAGVYVANATVATSTAIFSALTLSMAVFGTLPFFQLFFGGQHHAQ